MIGRYVSLFLIYWFKGHIIHRLILQIIQCECKWLNLKTHITDNISKRFLLEIFFKGKFDRFSIHLETLTVRRLNFAYKIIFYLIHTNNLNFTFFRSGYKEVLFQRSITVKKKKQYFW